MTGDAGPGETHSPARRPGRTALLVVAVLLLLGGGAAVAVGLLGQVADPPLPSAAERSLPTGSTAPGPSTSAAPTAPSPSAAAESVALPVSIRIPSIDVRSDLLTLSADSDGTLQVPQPGPDYDKAAWFDGSPRPGSKGPAVIEGHVDSAKNGPSVFYALGALTAGDRIEVARADGSTVAFEVHDVRVVPKNDFPTFEVYGNTAGPELRLITCGGPFDGASGHYEDNVVVFAGQVV
jgi:LPXTG-site transpeptidase (sortase) family protein